jgi:hypothetical protein
MIKILWKINQFFRHHCNLAVLDEKTGRWVISPQSKNIGYLKAENANGRHILVKPDSYIEPYYMLVDDLNIDQVTGHHQTFPNNYKPGRMIVETSPANYQVWIHSKRPLSLSEKRYWLKRLHSDPGAAPNNRWGRCPGFRNRKQKHKTDSGRYPLAKLIWIDWKNTADIPETILPSGSKTHLSHQPQGGVCHKNNITRSHYDKGNESATDFAYALALYRRGFSTDEISHRIIIERENWGNHLGSGKRNKYLHRTLKEAQRIIHGF